MSTKTVSFKADEQLKEDFDRVAKNLAMPVSAMYTVFMRKVVDYQGLPFELKVDSLVSREALEEKLTELLQDRIEQAEFVDMTDKAQVAKLMEDWDEW